VGLGVGCLRCCKARQRFAGTLTRPPWSTAVKGTAYCPSAARAVQLIVANAIRLATVNVVGDALLFLGKLAVASCCGVGAFALSNMQYYNDPNVSQAGTAGCVHGW